MGKRFGHWRKYGMLTLFAPILIWYKVSAQETIKFEKERGEYIVIYKFSSDSKYFLVDKLFYINEEFYDANNTPFDFLNCFNEVDKKNFLFYTSYDDLQDFDGLTKIEEKFLKKDWPDLKTFFEMNGEKYGRLKNKIKEINNGEFLLNSNYKIQISSMDLVFFISDCEGRVSLALPRFLSDKIVVENKGKAVVVVGIDGVESK